jgi:hypothetical protein
MHSRSRILRDQNALRSRARSQAKLTWPVGASGTRGAIAHNELTGKLLGLL